MMLLERRSEDFSAAQGDFRLLNSGEGGGFGLGASEGVGAGVATSAARNSATILSARPLLTAQAES